MDSPPPATPDEPDYELFPPFLKPKPAAVSPELDDDDDEQAASDPVVYRGQGSDPTFGYLIALALSFGLIPLIPDNSDLRYVIGWSILAGFGVLAWLLGSSARIEREYPENLVWGVVFGVIISAPLLAVGGGALVTTAHLLFRVTIDGHVHALTPGTVLALLLFVQPLAETLFFRGVMQENRPFWLVALAATVWSAVLYFPMLDIGRLPFVGIVIGTALLTTNGIYSYVRQRNGLAAAWLCQMVVNFILLFLPLIGA